MLATLRTVKSPWGRQVLGHPRRDNIAVGVHRDGVGGHRLLVLEVPLTTVCQVSPGCAQVMVARNVIAMAVPHPSPARKLTTIHLAASREEDDGGGS